MSASIPEQASWATVAPLLARWQIALVPQRDRTWDLVSGYPRACGLPVHGALGVLFADVPQAILDVAARCEAVPYPAASSLQRQCLECGTTWLQRAGPDTGCPQCR